jgi:hypothetical protein
MAVSSVSRGVLEAVIADARRRARYRRLRNTSMALLVVVLAAGLASQLAGHRTPATAAAPAAVASPIAHNGAIAILTGAQGPAAGWYGVSRIGTDGKLHPFIRCPRDAKWCGEPESIAWTARGDRLAISVTSFALPNPYNGLHVIDSRTHVDTQIRSCNEPPGECD